MPHGSGYQPRGVLAAEVGDSSSGPRRHIKSSSQRPTSTATWPHEEAGGQDAERATHEDDLDSPSRPEPTTPYCPHVLGALASRKVGSRADRRDGAPLRGHAP